MRTRYMLGLTVHLLAVPAFTSAQTLNVVNSKFSIGALGGLAFGSGDTHHGFAGVQLEHRQASRRFTLDGKVLFERGRACALDECSRNNGTRFTVGLDQTITRNPQGIAPYFGANVGMQFYGDDNATLGIRAGLDLARGAPITVRSEVGLTQILGAEYREAHVSLVMMFSLWPYKSSPTVHFEFWTTPGLPETRLVEYARGCVVSFPSSRTVGS